MKTVSLSARICRWAARIVSAFVLIMIVIIAVGEGMPVGRMVAEFVAHPLSTQSLGFVGFVLLVAGLLAGWKWELAGGIAVLAGVVALVEPTMRNGKITWFFAVMAAPGLLFIASRLLRLYKSSHPAVPENSEKHA
jgi:hypothetical protein